VRQGPITPVPPLEWEILLEAVRADGLRKEYFHTLLERGPDWAVLREAAVRHAVLPLVYIRLKEAAGDLVPAEEMARFREFYAANARRNLRLAQKMLRALAILSGRGIEAVPLKGPVLASESYGDLSLRQMIDVDILVRRQDFGRVYGSLEQAGYLPEFPLSGKRLSWQMRGVKHLAFSDRDDVLEIHWSLSESFFSFSYDGEECWPRLRTARLLEREVRAFSPEDELLILCIHGAKHCWARLGWIVDVARFLKSRSALDWSVIAERAEGTGARRIVALGLRLAEEVGGAVLVPEAEKLSRPDVVARSLSDYVKDRLPSYVEEPGLWESATFFLRSRERLRDRLFFILNRTFTPQRGDFTGIDLPAFLYPFYYVVRPFRLAYDRCLSSRLGAGGE
jgi:hypothetical protein